MVRVLFRSRAMRDLEDIAYFIARNNPERAFTFRDELIAKAELLADFPDQGTPVEHLGAGIRRLTHGSYLIFYRHRPETQRVYILRVVEGHRDVGRLRLD